MAKELKKKPEKPKPDKNKKNKPFICMGCREQWSHADMVGNVAGFCPKCGGAVRSKELDEQMTQNRVKRTVLARGKKKEL
jgi:rRNA maturation endonuclease Nob1